jgi:hypothetical protein
MKKDLREVKYSLQDLAEWIKEEGNAPFIVLMKVKRIANSIHLPKNLSDE